MSFSDEVSSDETPSQQVYSFLRRNLNFYRLHILYFTFTPFIFSGIFYASNGHFRVAYIDALFNSVSAMAVCGLASVDLSSLTGWQQAILFLQMCLGNPVLISWVVVYVRRRMFMVHCENIVRVATRKPVPETPSAGAAEAPALASRITSLFRVGSSQSTPPGSRGNSPSRVSNTEDRRGNFRRVRPDMIRRADDAPKLVDPSGWISEGQAGPVDVFSTPSSSNWELSLPTGPHTRKHSLVEESRTPSPVPSASHEPRVGRTPRGHSENYYSSGSRGRPTSSEPYQRIRRFSLGATASNADEERTTPRLSPPRTQTIEFASYPQPRHRTSQDASRLGHTTSKMKSRDPTTYVFATGCDGQSTSSHATGPLYRSESIHTSRNAGRRAARANFGGFPGPRDIISRLIHRFLPSVHRQLTRTVTMPRTTTITSVRGNTGGAKAVRYISFDAVVGHNSVFKSLTDEQLEELGGVEFRALNTLLWIVGFYHISVQLLGYTIIAPYMSSNKWKNDFRPPQQHRPIIPAWFSAFQVVSAYTNAGMSLVDQSMVPFQRAYPMIFAMISLILAGNTAFPIFLRFLVWIIAKLVPRNSQLNETLHFLLDHPRRCFIYLFPSHQTWFLLTVLIILNTTDWFFFLLLDLGNKAIESIPVGVRVIDGMLQAAAVRAAGFAIVSLSSLAPAVKVLYVIMMYISVYPIAMRFAPPKLINKSDKQPLHSVRSTNVYEEKSLGIYEDDTSIDEEDLGLSGNRVTVWGNYLAMHARRQLAFGTGPSHDHIRIVHHCRVDMWWLGLALFLLCIIERDQLENTGNATWFNIFNIVFELVSAYGGVGLSLGIPHNAQANYSFSGTFRPLSKLIVCLVMLRGRHRGLPVAIDRAVLLPFEYRRPPGDSAPDPAGPMRR
ncbi:cation transport protein-domain-containing protein [Lactifluus subvellereus]|nr:cation transport protein-domain-containing protein [Lactifluus subvellereus]